MAVLIDTSAGSIFFRRRQRDLSFQERATRLHVRDLLASGEGRLPWPVIQELLSGIRIAEQYLELAESLRAVQSVPCIRADFEQAARFFNMCLDAGDFASDFDILICAVAERLKAPIFTLDGDFERYRDILGIELYEPD